MLENLHESMSLLTAQHKPKLVVNFSWDNLISGCSRKQQCLYESTQILFIQRD